MTDQITVSVDPDVANAYRLASDNDRRKLDLLVNLRLRDATRSKASLNEVMLEISHNAQQRGLTPEILKSILDGRANSEFGSQRGCHDRDRARSVRSV